MKKFLVLGSSGQIGNFLVSFLRKRGHEVIEFDLVNSQSQDLRIKDNVLLEQYMNEVDFVFFLAFDVGGSRYLSKYQNTFEFLHNNVQIMENTFDCLRKCGVPFIFASSQMSNMEHSSYGLCKAIGEQYTKCLGGLPVKFWNVYGPENDFDKSHVITDFIISAKSGSINMISDGTEYRQFLYVEDCCECLLILSDLYDTLARNQEYHISSFKWNSVFEIASIVSDIFGGVDVVASDKKDLVQNDKRNEPNPYILNYWKPKNSIEEGIRGMCNYYDN
jgi:nucleoside-diphosphate-sugar epimerase